MSYFDSDSWSIRSIPIQRSGRRKRIAIQLQVNGSLKILAPATASGADLQHALDKFRPWLQKKISILAALPENERCFKFVFDIGQSFFLFGKLYKLHYLQTAGARQITFHDDALWSSVSDPQQLPALFEAFYRQQARTLISDRLAVYTSQFNINIGKLKITGARRRFGSCSSAGNLNFSYLLAMYPPELIDLVILHELAHRQVMNHSRRFYQVLAGYLPDHQSRSRELKVWSRKLSAYPQ